MKSKLFSFMIMFFIFFGFTYGMDLPPAVQNAANDRIDYQNAVMQGEIQMTGSPMDNIVKKYLEPMIQNQQYDELINIYNTLPEDDGEGVLEDMRQESYDLYDQALDLCPGIKLTLDEECGAQAKSLAQKSNNMAYTADMISVFKRELRNRVNQSSNPVLPVACVINPDKWEGECQAGEAMRVPFEVWLYEVNIKDSDGTFIDYPQESIDNINKEQTFGKYFFQINEDNTISNDVTETLRGEPISTFNLNGYYNPDTGEINVDIIGKGRYYNDESFGDWEEMCSVYGVPGAKSYIKANYNKSTGDISGEMNLCAGTMKFNIYKSGTTPNTPELDCPAGTVEENGECVPIQCAEGFVLQAGQCVPIECPEGEIMQDGECITPDIDIQVTKVGGDELPLLTDGKSKVVYDIVGKYPDGRFVDLEIRVGYTTGPKKGTIDVQGDKSGYNVVYTSPAITGYDASLIEDYLYMLYTPANGGEKAFKKYKIELSPISNNQAKITKPGIKDKITPIQFAGAQTKVQVLLVGPNGDKVPVNNASIEYGGYFSAYTDENGFAILDAPDGKQGDKIQTQEILVEITEQVQESITDANTMYAKMLTEGYISANANINDFIQNFHKYLARQPDEFASKRCASGIQRLPTTLAILNSGNKTAVDASKNIANSWTNMLWDLYDLAKSVETVNKWMQGALGKILKGVDKGIGYGMDKLGITDKLMELSAKLGEKLGTKYVEYGLKLGEKMGGDLVGVNVIDVILLGLKRDIVDGVVKKVMGFVLIKSGNVNPDRMRKLTDAVVQKLLEDIGTKPLFDSQAWGSLIQDHFMGIHKENNDAILTFIGNKIANNDFPDYSAQDVGIQNARAHYVEFQQGMYALKHDQEFEMSWFKDAMDSILFVTKGATGEIGTADVGAETLIKNLTTTFNNVEKAWKIFKSTLFDGVFIVHWHDAFGLNEEAIKTAAYWAMNEHIAYEKPDYREDTIRFIQQTWASEKLDLLQAVYESNLDPNSPEADKVLQYYEAGVDVQFYDEMELFAQPLAQTFPDDADVQSMYQNIAQSKAEAVSTYEQLEPQIMAMSFMQDNGLASGKNMFWGFLVLIVVYAVLLGLLQRFKWLFWIIAILGGIILASSLAVNYEAMWSYVSTWFATRTKDTVKNNKITTNTNVGNKENIDTNKGNTDIVDTDDPDEFNKDQPDRGVFVNQDYGYMIYIGIDVVPNVQEIAFDDLGWANMVYLYCYDVQDTTYDEGMGCPAGTATLFEIDVYNTQQYNQDVKDSPYPYTLLGQEGDNWFVLTHPNGELHPQVQEIMQAGLLEVVKESFSI